MIFKDFKNGTQLFFDNSKAKKDFKAIIIYAGIFFLLVGIYPQFNWEKLRGFFLACTMSL